MPKLVLSLILLSGCTGGWQSRADAGLRAIIDATVETHSIARPTIKTLCDGLVEKCRVEKRDTLQLCPEAVTCVKGMETLTLSATSILAITKQISLAIELGNQEDAAKMLHVVAQMLNEMRNDYERIRELYDHVKGADPWKQ